MPSVLKFNNNEIIDSSGKVTTSAVPADHIIQVQHMFTNTLTLTTSTTFVDTNIHDKITPVSASSKILILLTDNGGYKGNNLYFVTVVRTIGGTTTDLSANNKFNYGYGHSAAFTTAIAYVDEPNTTEEITYMYQLRTNGGSDGVYQGNGSATGSMVLLEIKG